MESSSDDGDPSTAAFIKTSFVLFICLFAPFLSYKIIKKPQSTVQLTNTSSAQAAAPVVKHVKKKPKKKKLYLTFDDGPNKGTKNVLNIVQDEQVPVTFFIVGEHVFASNKQHEVWDSLRMAEHIAICNHSYSHAHNRYEKFYSSPEGVVDDFERTQDSLNLDNPIVRTPGRNIWRIDSIQFTDLKKSTAAADSLQKAGFIVMGWDLEWQFDHKTMRVTTKAEDIVKQIDSIFKWGKTKRPDHLVLLAHDQVYDKTDDSLQLRLLLQQLKQKEDIELALVTTYPGTNKRDTVVVK
jgi:peptidoglycan/xylan/chitin deacetylase (PgdA/CDA1 family)